MKELVIAVITDIVQVVIQEKTEKDVVLLAKNYRSIVGGLLDRGEKCMQVADKAKDKVEKFKDDKTGLTAKIEYEKRVAQTMADLSKAEGSWINRLALGVTSFVDNALGRDDAATPKAVKAAAMSASVVGRKPTRAEKKVIKEVNNRLNAEDRANAASKFIRRVGSLIENNDMDDPETAKKVDKKIRRIRKDMQKELRENKR